jgi:hypothetical protein
MMGPEKPPDKFFSQKNERKLVGLFIQLSPEDLADCEEEVLACFKRAHTAHDKADRTVNRIWRRVVKGAAS